MQKKLIALHGFLGRPSDWDFFQFPTLNAFDLFLFTQWKTLEEWSDQFCHLHEQEDRPILMGYSMGGRFALHALIQNPRQWGGGVIISAHPGLSDEQEKTARLQEDIEWAARVEGEEWDSLIRAWNSQSVFAQDTFEFKRSEKEYRRSALAWFLRHGSLGKQKDLQQQISRLKLPILWIAGEKDEKNRQFMQDQILSHPQSKKVVISKAGHRCPWEQPQIFKETVMEWIERL